MAHHWTEEQYQFLADNIEGTSYKRMTELFNERFNTDLSTNKVGAALRRRKLTNGISAEFTKGHIPFNKGLKGWDAGGNSHKTRYQKGRISENYKPVGTERIDKEGYTYIKVSNPNVWELKHRHIWKESGRELPEGSALLFADGDRTNITLENLILINRQQLALMNKNDLSFKDRELNETALNIVNMMMKIKEKSKSI